MSEATKPSEGPKHIPALDGVRGLAIVMVMFTHFSTVFAPELPGAKKPNGDLYARAVGPVESAIGRFGGWGGYGVDLFFVLSGFLITGILLDSRESPTYFRSFYMRRVLRIFPLYYFYLFFIALIRRPLMIWLWDHDPNPALDLRWHLAYLSNWTPHRGLHPDEATHFWSLAIEEQFYLVWPMVVYLLPRRFLGYACAAGIALSIGLREYFILKGSWYEVLHRATPLRMDTLLLGALMALAIRDAAWRKAVERWAVPVGLAAATWFVLDHLGYLNPRGYSTLAALGWTIPGVAFAAFVFWSATRGQGSRFLTSRGMTTLGRYSYGLYVWHLFACRAFPYTWVHEASVPAKLAYIAGLMATSGFFAFLSWNLLEQPFLKLKKFFPYRAAGQAGPARPAEIPTALAPSPAEAPG